MDDIDVNKILFSKKEGCGKKNFFKYFIGYDGNDDIRPLCIRLPQMIRHAKYFPKKSILKYRTKILV